MTMAHVEQLFRGMDQRGDRTALVWRGCEYSYRRLLGDVDRWAKRLSQVEIGRGAVCGVMGDYSPAACALLLATMKAGAILVPFTRASGPQVAEMARMAGVQRMVHLDEGDGWSVEAPEPTEDNQLITSFRKRGHPGLVVFTSGSTGRPKGILHDCQAVLGKFGLERPGYRTLLFLLMDHFGGFNTLMSVFAYGGTAVVPANRTPHEVCRAVEQGQVELLPVTPTFLNMLLQSKCYKDFDLSSVKLITYGTEVMPEATLHRLAQVFPSAKLQQTYGLSELGVLRSRSKGSDSLWVKVGGQGFETKVIDGTLYIRSESAMVGYLNAPSPFDGEGWMNTGDRVEVDGDYLRILGRQSEIINVGGQKVFPTEVEATLLNAENVTEATVYGVPNAFMGSVVAAQVSLEHSEDPVQLRVRLRRFCLERLAPYKVPSRFTVVPREEHYGDRGKKVRPVAGA